MLCIRYVKSKSVLCQKIHLTKDLSLACFFIRTVSLFALHATDREDGCMIIAAKH